MESSPASIWQPPLPDSRKDGPTDIGAGADVGKVVLCTISAGEPKLEYMTSLIEMINHELGKPIEERRLGAFSFRRGTTLLHMCRNEHIREVMKSYAQEWLFLVDDDIQMPADTLDKLLEHAHPVSRPIVGAPYKHPFETPGIVPSVFFWDFDSKPHPATGEKYKTYIPLQADTFSRLVSGSPTSLVRCDSTGLGCVLIHRSVFSRMYESNRWHKALPWFNTDIAENDVLMGEDHTFFRRAASLGFPLYIRGDISLKHIKKASYE